MFETAEDQVNHENVFEEAWTSSAFTQIELPPVDINRVLSDRYRMSESLTFTREMLWNVEVRKAWRPDRYIPSVVKEGSAVTWGGRSTDDGNDRFLRASMQRRWLEPERYELVLENCYVNVEEKKVTFIGAPELDGPSGELMDAQEGQPLFHVVHSVDGEADRPLNRWRIVHLTDGPDQDLIDRFERMAEDPWLPEYVEIYLRDDLNVDLARRDAE